MVDLARHAVEGVVQEVDVAALPGSFRQDLDDCLPKPGNRRVVLLIGPLTRVEGRSSSTIELPPRSRPCWQTAATLKKSNRYKLL